MINDSMFTSKRQDWQTPPDLFNELDKEFNFECDLFANKENALHENYYTEENSAFNNKWYKRNFANPPYKTTIQNRFFKEALERTKEGCTTVALVPARTSTKRFHDYVFNQDNVEVRFLKGRIRFIQDGQVKAPAQFPSCIIIFKGVGY